MTDRETVSRSLAAFAAKLADLKRQEFSTRLRVSNARNGWREEQFTEDGDAIMDADPSLVAYYKAAEKTHQARLDQIASIREGLASIGVAIEQDGAAWESERAAYDRTVQTLALVAGSPSADDRAADGEVTKDTLFSEAAAPVLAARREALEADGSKSRYADRLEDAFACFMDLIGDKPLRKYLPADIQKFATELSKVPTHRTKRAQLRGMTASEAIKANAALKKPLECMSVSHISGLVGEVLSTWRRATSGVLGIRDIGSASWTLPRGVTRSTKREGLSTEALTCWLADAAPRPEAHFHWVPLVGLITGMRLGEIVHIRGDDIVEVDGHVVIDLRRYVTGSSPRPLKTETSQRLVALHHLLHDVGFVEWARDRGSRWLFPAFHEARDPADAAQKRMSFWMKKLGIHQRQKAVFHSLRHNAKSWLRSQTTDRIADLHCGHAPDTVGANYGFRLLQAEEIERVVNASLPRDVDFSPYLKRGR